MILILVQVPESFSPQHIAFDTTGERVYIGDGGTLCQYYLDPNHGKYFTGQLARSDRSQLTAEACQSPSLSQPRSLSTVCLHIIGILLFMHDLDLPTFLIRALRIICKQTVYLYLSVSLSQRV